MNGPLCDDIDIKNHEVIDSLRAWEGRDQVYACTFKQDKLGYYKNINAKKIPILALCSREDVLWGCFHYCGELVRLVNLLYYFIGRGIEVREREGGGEYGC